MATDDTLNNHVKVMVLDKLDAAKSAAEVFKVMDAWLRLHIQMPDEIADAMTFALRRMDAKYNKLSVEPYMNRYRLVLDRSK